MARKEKANGSNQVEQVNAEPPQDASSPPPEPQGDGNPENPAPVQEAEVPQGEPGPEDFARHTGARLVADHEHDLRLQEEVTDRLKRRGHEIATRLRKSGPNATVIIGGKEHVARQRPANSGGGMLLAEVSARTPTALA